MSIGSVWFLLIWILFSFIILSIMIGWLRSWGAAILIFGGTLFGISFIEGIGNLTAIILRLAFGICIIIASYFCFREYKFARRQDKEEALIREKTSVILPTSENQPKKLNVFRQFIGSVWFLLKLKKIWTIIYRIMRKWLSELAVILSGFAFYFLVHRGDILTDFILGAILSVIAIYLWAESYRWAYWKDNYYNKSDGTASRPPPENLIKLLVRKRTNN